MARYTRREKLDDADLVEAINRAERGLVDADLGGGLIKQRVARKGQGRSGGYRMMLAYRENDRAVFLFGFAKNEQENIGDDELLSLRELAKKWLTANEATLHKELSWVIYRRSIMAHKGQSRLSEAILEMADDQLRSGLMNREEHEKITMRHLGHDVLSVAEPISGEEIRTLREKAHLSQAVFARYLNLTVGYVSQLERGTKQPKGPALTLLNVMRRKGFEAIL